MLLMLTFLPIPHSNCLLFQMVKPIISNIQAQIDTNHKHI